MDHTRDHLSWDLKHSGSFYLSLSTVLFFLFFLSTLFLLGRFVTMSTPMVAAAAGTTGTSFRDTMKEEKKKIEGLGGGGGGEADKQNADRGIDDAEHLNNGSKAGSGAEENSDLKSVSKRCGKEAEEPAKFTSKDQLDLGKQNDESSGNCKEKLCKSVDDISVTKDETKEPGVVIQVLNLTIESPGRQDEILPIPFRPSTSKDTLFTLKEGSKHRIVFKFVVKNTVFCLKYVGDVWKKGIKVDHSKKIVGTFSPREELYEFELQNGTTPSGIFARGSYSARAKFVDDAGKCYLDTIYYFGIQKNWASSTS